LQPGIRKTFLENEKLPLCTFGNHMFFGVDINTLCGKELLIHQYLGIIDTKNLARYSFFNFFAVLSDDL
jgi:hypothetical protein